jgi:hypothetical protein
LVLLMVKSERKKEVEKEYEEVSLIFGPKGKSGVQISSVPIKKLKALEEWHKKHHLPRKWRLSKDENRLILE